MTERRISFCWLALTESQDGGFNRAYMVDLQLECYGDSALNSRSTRADSNLKCNTLYIGVSMGRKYNQLSATERNDLHSRMLKGESLRSIARGLGRAASTLSREISRNSDEDEEYDSCLAGYSRRSRRRRGLVKLREGSALRAWVFEHVRRGWSPQQICGKLRQQRDDAQQGPRLPTVSHETIYRAIYVLPRGQIRRELVSFLRQHHTERLPLRRRADKRGGMIGMVSIHDRPADVLGREFPGDWEGDLIKGAGNASAIGTLIERKSRFTILVKMKDCSSRAALIGFRRELGKVPAAMRAPAWPTTRARRWRATLSFPRP
jgi:IS30 family transposase